jgi:transcription elongation factor GreA
LKLISPCNFSFGEALTQYVITKKNGKKTLEGQQEISRFVTWVGRERTISELTPSEVATYAQHIGLGGAESAQRLNPVKGFLTYLKEQGWVETSLAPHLRIPRSRRTSTPRRSASTDGTSNGVQSSGAQLSQEGYDRLQAQLESLKEERVRVVEDIKRAMEDKDFRENSPLDAAKERQGLIESKIRELESSLLNAQIWSESSQSAERQRVAIGVNVTLKEIDTGKLIRYTLVDVREANVSAGKISTASPVGQALLDRKVGETISVNVPRGTLQYSIEEIGV